MRLDRRQVGNLDLRPGFGGAVGDRLADRLQHSGHVDLFGGEPAAAFARQFQHRIDQAIHPLDRSLDDADRFVELLAQAVGGVRLVRVRCRAQLGEVILQLRDAGEDFLAQLFKLSGESHNVDERRTQVMADDVGETLDLFVGLFEIGCAEFDNALEVGVGGGELGLRHFALARVALHQINRQRADQHDECCAGERCEL